MTEKNKGGILFIINPVSGKGKARKAVKLIKKYCEKRRIKYTCHESKNPGDASLVSRKGLSCGYDRIVAVGGDGTVNEVGKELIGQSMPLGIIPTGSGNGLARHMGIPVNIKRSLKLIIKGKKALIDTGLMDGHPFLNTAGIGFDANVSKAFEKSVRRGWYSYVKIILKLGMNIKSFKLKLIHDGGSENIETVMLSMANSSQYGNNARIAPNADITDGKMDICILSQVGLLRAAFFAIKVMTGMVRKNGYFTMFQSKSLTVEGYKGWAHIDGDPVEINASFRVEMKPKSLYIIC